MATKRFPGFIDVHVHLREPGATQKEDFYTGSRAAIAGGVTFVIDMPNNPTPTVSIERLDEKVALAKKAICDIGFHYGTNGKNADTFAEAASRPEVFGLKLYCNHTTGEMLIEDPKLLETVFAAWPPGKPILVHAEGPQLDMAIALADKHGQRLHVCHITQASEVEAVRKAKAAGRSVTAGVCPHHLFMTEKDREEKKGYATMKPPLGTLEDQAALWAGLVDGTVDIVETNHAPHTKEEKEKDPPAFGVPGLETSLGLMLKAVADGSITEERVVEAMHTLPRKIFNIPEQPDTYVELDPDAPYTAGKDGYESKCGWSPFTGWELYGKPMKVVLRGKTLLEDGKIIA
ncbi:MAG: amidohydrolase family protein [Patescibacteria group bacterium]|nr:amidohydrolase family protein [Patescibacteria group bacterium]